MGGSASTKIALKQIGRRTVLAGAAGAAAMASFGRVSFAATKPLRIGVVGPITGQLAILYDGMPFILKQINQHLGRHVSVEGRNYAFEFVVRDSESDPNHASQVAQDLIFNEQVDVMTTLATPDTVNPVSDQCEANGVPCIGTECPLESFYLGRGAPKQGFEWTFNFFFGLHQMVEALTHEWRKVPSNKVIGVLYPNGADGQASARTFPPVLKENGWKVVDPGQFDLPSTYTAQIAAFRGAGVEVVDGVLPPPQFITFWNAAAQQGFRPKIMHMGKATEFPPAVTPLGKRAYNLSVETWWTPASPYVSGLTGISSRGLADTYEKATGKQWLMTLGLGHALIEAAFEALKTAKNPHDKAAVRDAIRIMNYKSIGGLLNFTTGPYPNTSRTPLAISQWRKGTKHPLELLVVDNSAAPDIPVQSEPLPIAYGGS